MTKSSSSATTAKRKSSRPKKSSSMRGATRKAKAGRKATTNTSAANATVPPQRQTLQHDKKPAGSAEKYVHGIRPDREHRERDDFYDTPPEAVRALLAVEKFDGPIWEPACGTGSLAKAMTAAGHEVIATDLVDRGYGTPRIDFLMEWLPMAPNIISNPPFKLAEQFVDKAMALATGKVAFLCRLAWLESEKRAQLFERTNLTRVWVFSTRLTISRSGVKSGSGMLAFAWYVWDRAYRGPTMIGFLRHDKTRND